MATVRTSVVVTIDGGFPGGTKRRYVVAAEDEHYFARVRMGKVPEPKGTPAAGGTVRTPSVAEVRQAREEHLGRFYFGCQWLRGFGRVDEMYRTLGTWEVVKVERLPRDRVWGSRA